MEGLIAEQPELAQNANGRVAWEGDALLKVLGAEKSGQVHGMGLLPTPKQVYGRKPRYLKNINMTTTDGSCEREDDVWEEIAKLKEHIRRQDQIIQDGRNKEKEGYGHIGTDEEVKEFISFCCCCMPFYCLLLILVTSVGKCSVKR